MKMKCLNCGKVITINNIYCSGCGTETKAKQRAARYKAVKTTVLIPLVALGLAFNVLCCIGHVKLWQMPLNMNRNAIINYVRENHPDSKIHEEHMKYYTSGYILFFELKTDCYITFEENGFLYKVSANKGKVYGDFHNPRKLENEVRLFINENFLDQRGIENTYVYCDFSFNEYHHSVPEQWSEYNDYYHVTLSIRGQGITPEEVGWIYDFYKFWKENIIFSPKWEMRINLCSANGKDHYGSIFTTHKSDYKSENELYKQFY